MRSRRSPPRLKIRHGSLAHRELTAPSPNPGTAHRTNRSCCGPVHRLALDELTADCSNELGIAATFLDEPREDVATFSSAFGTGHAQHIELADEIAEDDGAVAGHDDHDRIENLASMSKKEVAGSGRPVFQKELCASSSLAPQRAGSHIIRHKKGRWPSQQQSWICPVVVPMRVHVAGMSRGVTGRGWKPPETKANKS